MNGDCLWVRHLLGSMGIYTGFALVSPNLAAMPSMYALWLIDIMHAA